MAEQIAVGEQAAMVQQAAVVEQVAMVQQAAVVKRAAVAGQAAVVKRAAVVEQAAVLCSQALEADGGMFGCILQASHEGPHQLPSRSRIPKTSNGNCNSTMVAGTVGQPPLVVEQATLASKVLRSGAHVAEVPQLSACATCFAASACFAVPTRVACSAAAAK